MTFPVINATLTAVNGASVTEDYMAAPGPGAAVWTGEVRAYLEESLVEEASGDTLNVFRKTVLKVPSDVGRQIAADHTVAYRDEYGQAHTRRVREVAVFPIVGRASVVLENE